MKPSKRLMNKLTNIKLTALKFFLLLAPVLFPQIADQAYAGGTWLPEGVVRKWDPEVVSVGNDIIKFVGPNPKYICKDNGMVLLGDNGKFRIDFSEGDKIHDTKDHGHLQIPRKDEHGRKTRNFKDADPKNHRYYFDSRKKVGGGKLNCLYFLNDLRTVGVAEACTNLAVGAVVPPFCEGIVNPKPTVHCTAIDHDRIFTPISTTPIWMITQTEYVEPDDLYLGDPVGTILLNSQNWPSIEPE